MGKSNGLMVGVDRGEERMKGNERMKEKNKNKKIKRYQEGFEE